jgi:hypothetical protein
MEEHYIWLFNKSDNRGLLGAALGSLLLHVLMVVVMATTSVFYPTAGDASKIDVVWLYPSFLLGGETDTPSPVQSSPDVAEPVSPAREVIETPAPPPVSSDPEPARKTAPPSPPQVAEEEVEPPAIAPEPLNMEPDSEPEMTIPAPTAPVQTAKADIKPQEPVAKKETTPPPEKVPAAKKEDKPKSKPPVDNRELAKAEKPVPVPEPTQPPPAKVVPPPRETPPQAPKPPAAVPKPPAAVPKPPAAVPKPPAAVPKPPTAVPKPPAVVQQTAVKNSPPLPQVAPTMPRKEKAAVPAAPSPKPSLPASTGGDGKIAMEKRSEPPPTVKPVAVDKPVEKAPSQSTGPKGIFAPPLAGDLKIEITGPEELLKAVKISVIFREYPKTRHNRPMTKANSRNFRELTPKTARVAKNTLQAVIEIAGEGVYEFRDLSETASPGEASFSIKIYENSGRAKTKSAGTRKIGNKGSIAKVLMPEGILWNDDSAFSGSMEDSESITKFNSETGLTWKEYRE